MKRTLSVLVAGGGVLTAAGPARGQVVFGPVGYAGEGYRAGFGFTFGGPGIAVSGGYRAGYFNSYPVYGPVYGPGAVVVVPPPVVVVQPSAAAFVQSLFPPSPDAAELARRPVDRPEFKVVRPQVGGAKPPARRPDARDNPFAPNPGKAVAPDPGPVPKDPKQAAVFFVTAARTAFAAEEYGRAAERLADAIAAVPADPLAYFLLAQVRTARGEYAEAVAAIREGLKQAPDWPAAGFRVRELYGPTPRRFDDHLADLRGAAAANPDDPTLMFLLGYHLWFLGDKGDAAKLFRKAAGKVKDGGAIERFLIEADGKDA